jgi:3'-phosphoadenosine 5'-phosphosulfate sulfotransferase (PAPS reductase)/FAD synthetase
MIQVSFSGGRSSAMMAKIMLDNYDKDDLLFTFANTGKEVEETLTFVNECDKRWDLNMVWIEYCIINRFKVVNFKTASRNGEPFEALIGKRKYLPNRVTRFCTTELKIKPMAKYIRSLGVDYWDAAIGIRKDEPNRYFKMKQSKKKDRWDYIFPLWDFRITEKDVFEFWKKQGFDLAINSILGNCDFCFMKGLGKKVAQARLMPEKLEWWIEMEKKTGNRFTNDYTILDLQKLATQPTLFDTNEPNVSCFCGD